MLRRASCLFVALCLCLAVFSSVAHAATVTEEPRYGVSLGLGNTVYPNSDFSYALATVLGQWDVDDLLFVRAPEDLRFRLELSGGSTFRPEARIMGSATAFAVYYLPGLSLGSAVPYVELGVGGMYTDWHVSGQGSNFNFNPQAGIGLEFPDAEGAAWFTSLRFVHLSNGGLVDPNRSNNSLLLSVGRFF